MDIMEIVIDLICRTCLKMNGTGGFNIFEYTQNEKLISESIMELTSVKISKDDGFSVNICNNCLEKLNSANDFKEMVIKSDGELTQLHQSKIMENENELQQIASSLICAKDKSSCLINENLAEDLLLSNWEDTSINQENIPEQLDLLTKEITIEDSILVDCQNNSIKQTNISELLDLLSDSDSTTPISIKGRNELSCPELNKSLHINDQAPTLNNNIVETNSDISIKKKNKANHCTLSKKQLKLINNPDCRRIMESGLSTQEKDCATVFRKECNRTLSFRHYTERHKHLHTGNLLFKCDQCNSCFAKKYLLRRHMRMHPRKNKYRFEKSGKPYLYKQDLVNHQNISIKRGTISEQLNDYDCKISTSKIAASHPIDLDKSINENKCQRKSDARTKKKKHICSEEPLKLIDNGNNKAIMELSLNPQQKINTTIICEVCNQRMTYRHYVDHHVHTHAPTVDLPFKCDQCNVRYAKEYLLKRHMRVHTQTRKYMCENCGKSYFYKRDLDDHLVMHSGEKRITCKICGKLFAYKRTIVAHMKRHLGVKPHVCSTCGKRFIEKSYLDRHIVSHTGEKPYACKVCGKRFSQRSCLPRHMLTHPGEQPYSCKICTTSYKCSRHKNKDKNKDDKEVLNEERSENGVTLLLEPN